MSINSNNKSNVKNNPSEFDNFGNSAVPQQKLSGVTEDRRYQIYAGSGGDSIYAEEFNQSTDDGLTLYGLSTSLGGLSSSLGGVTPMIAPPSEDGSALFTSACVYGGPTKTVDDCGNVNAGITGGGATVGAAYDFDNGFTAALGAQTTESDVLTDESADAYALNAAYSADSYGVSVAYAIDDSKSANNTSFGSSNEFTSGFGIGTITDIGNKPKANNTSFGHQALNGKFGSDETPEVDFSEVSYGETGPGSFGLATTQVTGDADEEEYQYEVYYSYPVNDGMTITPLVYSQNQDSSNTDDEVGTLVTTSFAFSGKRNAKNKKNKLISLGKKPKQQKQKKNNNNSGFNQTAFGKNTLSKSSANSNTAFGTESGTSITKGKRNTLIGNSTDISEENGLAQLVIGHGAKGHGNYIGVLGGSNKNEKSNEQTALKAIIPSVNNYTNLGSTGSTGYKYKELFVNKLNNGKEYTLPTESDINKDDLMISDNNGKLSFKTLDKFKGFYVERTNASKSKQKIESRDGVATMSVDDIIKSQGRIYLDANTTSIKFTSSAEDFIEELGLTKDYDFTSNLYIFTESTTDLNPIDSMVEVDDTDNISLTYFTFYIFSTKQFGDLAFGGTSTRLVIRRLTSEKIEIEFSL